MQHTHIRAKQLYNGVQVDHDGLQQLAEIERGRLTEWVDEVSRRTGDDNCGSERCVILCVGSATHK